ncbi:head maturation protease, ClpP-related [Trichococcus collinsii]|uniref:ATP-dependent Clp protease proteolytic subunit n=1 Tax=Trichococcus collinsii TaxID=157076 RepID=A0AB38A3W8_9LACT|nr:head maturation protease, ClpP-related [Trichococcus collinsii]CZR10996.1 atp-dependent clp protease proteolytic subunit [Trichococcus collinsii]SEA95607.1 ATP-dependent protease ClpP, protease subunit [Trichococcus collinsii]
MKLNELMKKNPIENKLEIKNEAEGTIELFMYGTVGYSVYLNGIKYALGDVVGNEINVHINSYGGDLFEGIAIKNFLLNRPEKINVYIDGIAASAASVIAMAGDHIVMPSDAQMMIHNPWTYTMGNAKELRKTADDLDKAQTSLEKSYMNRFKGTEDELKTLLDEETYLTADEAVLFGLADKIDGQVSDDDEPNAKAALIKKFAAQAVPAVTNTVETPEETKPEVPQNTFAQNLLKILEVK